MNLGYSPVLGGELPTNLLRRLYPWLYISGIFVGFSSTEITGVRTNLLGIPGMSHQVVN